MTTLAKKFQALGGTKRPDGGTLSRFVGTAAHGSRQDAALAPSHPAVREGRTLFPTMVALPENAPRLLVSGHNSAKTGIMITKGRWAGMPIFTLTLEERATCPRACSLWRECYGNSSPMSRRHAYTPRFLPILDAEIYEKASLYERFAVRLHVLGDFPDRVYLHAWLRWMRALPGLHVWGYTAHPAEGRMGRSIARMNARWPDRWVVRFSVDEAQAHAPRQATSVWATNGRLPEVDGIICPAQTHATACCGTCALCWSPAIADKRIVFIGHGINRRRAKAAA